MKDHEATHTEVKQYVCKECGKGFTQKWNLKKHIVTEHKERSENKEDDGNDSENVSEEQEMPKSTETSLEDQETDKNMTEEEETQI